MNDLTSLSLSVLLLTTFHHAVPASSAVVHDWVLGGPFTLEYPKALRKIGLFYDGNTPLFPDPGNPNQLIWFFPGRRNYRAVIKSTTFDDINSKGVFWQPDQEVYPFLPGGKGEPLGDLNRGDNKGGWLNSIFPQGGQKLLAIFHAEDNYFKNAPVAPNNVAWMSVMVAHSFDAGMTWDVANRRQVLTARADKPADPRFGGVMAHGAFYDDMSGFYFVYFREDGKFCMARSSTPSVVDSWKKYLNGEFTEPGLQGDASPVPGFERGDWLDPAVVYCEFLGKYLMLVIKGKGSASGNSLYCSTSDNLTSWSQPRLLIESEGSEWIRYPTLIAWTKSKGTTNLRMDREGFITYKWSKVRGDEGQDEKARRCVKFSLVERTGGRARSE